MTIVGAMVVSPDFGPLAALAVAVVGRQRALAARAAVTLALTSRKSGALVGVFISVMTVPAAGFAAVAAVYGEWTRSGEALLQLFVNLVAITAAGAVALRFRGKHVGRGQVAGLLSGRRRG